MVIWWRRCLFLDLRYWRWLWWWCSWWGGGGNAFWTWTDKVDSMGGFFWGVHLILQFQGSCPFFLVEISPVCKGYRENSGQICVSCPIGVCRNLPRLEVRDVSAWFWSNLLNHRTTPWSAQRGKNDLIFPTLGLGFQLWVLDSSSRAGIQNQAGTLDWPVTWNLAFTTALQS